MGPVKHLGDEVVWQDETTVQPIPLYNLNVPLLIPHSHTLCPFTDAALETAMGHLSDILLSSLPGTWAQQAALTGRMWLLLL